MPNEWGDIEVNEWGDAPAVAAEPPKTFMDKAGDSVNSFFGRGDPKRPTIANPGREIGQQMLKAGAFLVPGSGAASLLGSGALFGAGTSEATTPGEFVRDTAEGAAGSLVGGKLIQGGGKLLKKAAGPVADRLRSAAIEQGRKALSGIGTPLSARKEVPAAVVEQALSTGAIKPLGTVAGTAQRLEAQAGELGAQYGAILKELEAQGVVGPNARLLADEILSRANEGLRSSLGSPRPGFLRRTSTELRTKVSPDPLDPETLGLMQAEEIKRGLQAEARREYDKITRQTTTLGETKKELASMVRDAIEQSIANQASKAPEAAAAFEPVKRQLSNTLGGLRVAEEGAARAARRKPVSLTSTIVGSAAGTASGSPAVGLASAVGHGLVDSRLASTLARAYYGGANMSSALARAMPNAVPAGFAAPPAAESSLVPALLNAMKARLGQPGLVPVLADEESAR